MATKRAAAYVICSNCSTYDMHMSNAMSILKCQLCSTLRIFFLQILCKIGEPLPTNSREKVDLSSKLNYKWKLFLTKCSKT